MSLRTGVSIVVLASGVVACDTSGDMPRAVIADSAGVRVVVNPPTTPDQESWTLGSSPIVTIGVQDGPTEYQLFEVSSGTVLSDGSIVIADGGSLEVRFYDHEGRFLRAAGGPGEGPGEFQTLTLAGTLAGDSLVAWDTQSRRVSVFDRNAAFARSFAPGRGDDLTSPFLAAVLLDGTSVMQYRPSGSTVTLPSGARRTTIEVYLMERMGAIGNSLGRFPGSESLILSLEGMVAVSPVVFGRSFHLAGAVDRFAIANDSSFSIRVYDSRGELDHVVRQGGSPVPIGADDYERIIRERFADGQERQIVAQVTQQMPRYETYPALASLKIDEALNLWVEACRMPGLSQSRWQVFDPDGFLAATVETPGDMQVLEIGEDYLLGVHRSELEVESVRLHRLDKG